VKVIGEKLLGHCEPEFTVMFRKDIDKIIQWLKDGDIQEAYNFFEQYSGPDDIN